MWNKEVSVTQHAFTVNSPARDTASVLFFVSMPNSYHVIPPSLQCKLAVEIHT